MSCVPVILYGVLFNIYFLLPILVNGHSKTYLLTRTGTKAFTGAHFITNKILKSNEFNISTFQFQFNSVAVQFRVQFASFMCIL